MSSVFLSHSHKDKAFAKRLAKDLRRKGHIVWIDEAEILVGDSLTEKIREGLDRVEFIVAIISKSSVKSDWVKRELDIGMNLELKQKRIKVLPILISSVQLPGFLEGKRYADFREKTKYSSGLKLLLQKLGSSTHPPRLSAKDTKTLKAQLAVANKLIKAHNREMQRHRKLISMGRSSKLKAAIREENRENPEYSAINDAYAFEVSDTPVTLDYLLWAINKAAIRGGHPLEFLLTVEGKWENVRLMLEAYADYLGLNEQPEN